MASNKDSALGMTGWRRFALPGERKRLQVEESRLVDEVDRMKAARDTEERRVREAAESATPVETGGTAADPHREVAAAASELAADIVALDENQRTILLQLKVGDMPHSELVGRLTAQNDLVRKSLRRILPTSAGTSAGRMLADLAEDSERTPPDQDVFVTQWLSARGQGDLMLSFADVESFGDWLHQLDDGIYEGQLLLERGRVHIAVDTRLRSMAATSSEAAPRPPTAT